MNIAEVCLNSSLGGLELYFFWCCEYFQKTNHNLTAVTVPGSRLQGLLNESQIETELIRRDGLWGRWQAARELARLFDQKKIDIVHAHYAKDLPILALAKQFSRRRWSLIMSRQMEMPGSKKDLYHRWVYSQVDLILCVTDKLMRDVRERVPISAQQVTRLYYGVPIPQQNVDRRHHFLEMFPSPLPKVAMFSRLEKKKGQWRLLEVQSRLFKQGIKFQTYLFGHFMGGDGYEEELRSFIKKEGLESSVYFCGFQKKPSELMRLFDVVVLPSDEETFGLVLIEAMAARVAVMGTQAGGVPEIIEDGKTGFTFLPEDLDTFAHKLRRLLQDEKLREKFIEGAFERYNQAFNASSHFASLESLMVSALPRK